MKGLKIYLQDVQMQDVLEQMDMISGADHRERNCLRLLAEEMFSMMNAVLEHRTASFEIARKDNEYSLTLETVAEVSRQARAEYLSMSSDGSNLAHKGLIGKMVALFEAMADGGTLSEEEMGMMGPAGDYMEMWSMSSYMDTVSDVEKEKAWDGMEKSIILTFADDVAIGVQDNKVKMIVKKKF